MRRSTVVAFALAAALLMLAAPPAAAADANLEVASEHRTESELSNGTLDGTFVSGSGTNAFVTPAQTYNPVDDEGDGETDGNDRAFVGDDSGDSPLKTELRVEPDNSGTVSKLTVDVSQDVGSDYDPNVDIYIVQEAPDSTYGEGTLVKSNWDPDFSSGEQSIDIDDYDVSAGQTYTVEFVTKSSDNDGTTDRLAIRLDSSASSVWYTSNTIGTRERYPDITLTSAGGNGTYISDTHDGSQIREGWANLTLSDAEATVTWQASQDGGSSWSNVTQTAYSSTGNYTADLSGTDADDWRVRVDFSETGSSPTAELHDEGVLFQAETPSGSNPDPADGSEVDSYDGDISLDVNDSDFSTEQGDSVNVTAADGDGTQIGQTDVTSNGTVTFSYAAKVGANNITWTLADDYGESTTVSQDFATPANLTFRNETNPSEVVDNVEVEVRFFDGTITNNTTTNGRVNMDGTPAGRPLTVVATADGYHKRTIRLDSIFQQRNIYLLNESEDTNEIRFQIDDRTGGFDPAESTIRVEKPITLNGTTEYRIVAADEAGVNGFAVFLEADRRYRVSVENSEGDVRTIEPYTAPTSETVSLTTGSLTYGTDDAEGVTYDASYIDSATSGSGKQVVFNYSDPENETTDLDVVIYERGNESNELYNQTAATGPIGNASVAVGVPASGNNTNWVVDWQADRDGEQIGSQATVGSRADLVPSLDDFWKRVAGIFIVLITGGMFSQRNVAWGVIVTGIMAGMLWQVGWMGGATSGVAIVIVIAMGAWLNYAKGEPVGV